MDNLIGKGDDAADRLMDEVEALFEMNPKQREAVVDAVNVCTDPDEPVTSYLQFYEMAGLFECRVAGQPLQTEDVTDGDGNPDGGFVEGCGLSIRWQRGPINKDEVPPWNGCFPVAVLEAVLHRLVYYQDGKYACDDNEKAIEHIEKAIDILNRRQVERFCRGVQGEHKK